MGEARRKAQSLRDPLAGLRAEFVAREQVDPTFLEKYARWVQLRPRDAAYEARVREVVPRLAGIVEARLERENCLAACQAVSNMVSRMLDRLGIWSYVVRGSLAIEATDGASVEPRRFPIVDRLDHPDNITGHAWVAAPPFAIIDVTLRHQRWTGEDLIYRRGLPAVLAADHVEAIEPKVDDCVALEIIAMQGIRIGRPDPRLLHRLLPDLARFGRKFPASRVVAGTFALRYVPHALTASDLPLEECGPLAVDNALRPVDVWERDVRPAFDV